MKIAVLFILACVFSPTISIAQCKCSTPISEECVIPCMKMAVAKMNESKLEKILRKSNDDDKKTKAVDFSEIAKKLKQNSDWENNADLSTREKEAVNTMLKSELFEKEMSKVKAVK